jgi:hypothetical protein
VSAWIVRAAPTASVDFEGQLAKPSGPRGVVDDAVDGLCGRWVFSAIFWVVQGWRVQVVIFVRM